MRVRTFYPRQVIRKLQGEHRALNDAQTAVLRFELLRGRKLGYAIEVGPRCSVADFAGSCNALVAQAVLANCTTHIILRPSI